MAGRGLRRNPIQANLLPRQEEDKEESRSGVHVLPAPSLGGSQGKRGRKGVSSILQRGRTRLPESTALPLPHALPVTSYCSHLDGSPLGPARAAWPCRPMTLPGGCLGGMAGCQWCHGSPSSSRRLFSWLLCWEQAEVAYPHEEMIPKRLPLEWCQEQGVYNSNIPRKVCPLGARGVTG